MKPLYTTHLGAIQQRTASPPPFGPAVARRLAASRADIAVVATDKAKFGHFKHSGLLNHLSDFRKASSMAPPATPRTPFGLGALGAQASSASLVTTPPSDGFSRCERAHVRACACACARVCARACARVCLHEHVVLCARAYS